MTENDQTITFLSKKNLKTSHCTRSLQFWKNCQKNSRQKSNIFAQRPKNLSKISSFQGNVLKLFLWTPEHFESSFDNPARFFCLLVQTFLVEFRKWFTKTIFLQIFSSFFRISRLLFDTLPFLCQKTNKLLKHQNRWTIKTFFSKNLWFSSKRSSRHANCSCDNPEENFSD